MPKDYSVTASGAKRPLRGPSNDTRLAKEESFKSRYNLQGQYEGGGSQSNGKTYKTKFVLDPQKSGKLVPLAKTTVTDKKGKTKASYGATVRRAETKAGVVPSLKGK